VVNGAQPGVEDTWRFKMTTFKTWLFAAAAVFSIITTAAAETELEQASHWLSQFGPEFKKMIAVPDVAVCRESNFDLCKQRVFGEILARIRDMRVFLDQQPAPKCLQETEAGVRQLIAKLENTIEVARPNPSDPAAMPTGALMRDVINQMMPDLYTATLRDIRTCSS